MPTANERLFDASIAHAIDFSRYNNGVVRRLIAILNRADKDLFAQLSAALERLPAESFTVERLDSLLVSVSQINKAAQLQVGKALETELRNLVDYEAGYQLSLFESVLPVQVSTASVIVPQVYAAALARPFQGRLLSEWSDGIEADKMARIRDALRMGYIEGQTIDQMVSRLRGTRARGYEDGIIEIDRRNCAAMVRTATAHTASFTRQRFYDANSDLIKGERYCATLDGRTTVRCASLDGQVFKPGEGPIPPLHWQCRSTRTPILKSWRELGIDMEELSPTTRASMDGQVPQDTTYQQWLKKKPAAFQDDVLGPTKGKLFRDGDMTLDRFIDRKGKELTLDELRKKDAEAFRRAGL